MEDRAFMIVGVGVDLVDLSRFRRILRRSGTPLLCRVFTPAERRYCAAQAKPWESYAVRFAAKEAVLKVLGLGIAHDRLTGIEVVGLGGVPPALRLTGAVRRVAARRRIRRWHLSLSHASDAAVAMVMAER